MRSLTQIVPLVLPQHAQLVKMDTFWKTTHVMFAAPDSLVAMPAVHRLAAHAIQVTTLTQPLVLVPLANQSSLNAWFVTSTAAHPAPVGTSSSQELAVFAPPNTPTVSHALLQCVRAVNQGCSWKTGHATLVSHHCMRCKSRTTIC